MSLPLPYTLGDEQDPVQANFDFIKKRWPLSRKDMGVESPHVVGAAGEPAFQGTWANLGAPWEVARFWKDPVGIVHVEGLITGGTVATTAFTLPAGYRPRAQLRTGTVANGAFAFTQVNPDGTVVPTTTATAHSLNIHFRQEQ